jgi:MFS family permease
MVIGDGLATEAMTTFTSGTFLIAMALLLGASNFQIGLLAALPTFTNIFQLISIWLVRRFNNRRAISVICALLARIPLVIIGLLCLLNHTISINTVIFFLFFNFLFGSIAGPSWNAWMKDLIPENLLGTYFSRRSSYTQMLNVGLSLILALFVDYIKTNYPQAQLITYSSMFIVGGLIGIIGAFVLSKAPEPISILTKENIFKLLRLPLRDSNFRQLLIFNSAWVFAINIATPFFIVFLMKGMGLSITYIIGFTIISQLCSILTIRIWGQFADRYSNKTIIAISAPLYILCLAGWCFVGIYSHLLPNLLLLFLIYAITGVATAGINLSITNLSLKLSPSEDAIIYLSSKDMTTAFFSSFTPLLGGYMADFFNHRSLTIDARFQGPELSKVIHLIHLHEWNFLFLIAAILAFVALELLISVNETGEVDKFIVTRIMRGSLKSSLREYFLIGHLISWHEQIRNLLRKKPP